MNRREALVATLGSGADVMARQGVQFVFLLVLARLASPADFGIVALLGVVVGVANVAADLGLTTAILQVDDPSREELDTAFWTTTGVGVALAAAGASAAPALAAAFDRPDLASLAAFMTLAVAMTALGVVPTARLVRAARFGRLLSIGLAASVTSGSLAVLIAANGEPLTALATQVVALPAINSLLLLSVGGFRPRLVWNRAAAARLLPAGRWVLWANLLDVAMLRLQVVVIGSLFGAAPLGRYQRADSTQQLAADASSIVVSRVALPLFAKSAHRPDLLRAGYRTGLRSVSVVNAPIMALMAALAAPLLETLYGPQWSPAAPVLVILCVAGLLWPLHTMALNTLYALTENRLVFRIDIVKKVVMLVFLAIGATFGLEGIAWAQVCSGVVAVVINGLALQSRLSISILGSVRELLAPTALAVIAGTSAAMAAAAWSAPPWLEVIAIGSAGLLLYAALAVAFRVGAVLDLIAVARSRPQVAARG